MAVKASRGRFASERWRNLPVALAFLSPFIVGFIAFNLIPMVLSLYFAFTDYTGAVWPPHWIGGLNFAYMVDGTTDPLFWTSVANTVWFMLVSVPIGLAVSLALAVLLNSSMRGIGIYRTIFFLPSLLPFVATTLIFLFLLNPEVGMVNQILGDLHLPQPGWFTDPLWAKPGLVVQGLWGGGSSMIIFLAGLQGVPEEVHESAQIDGAGAIRRFWSVTLPLITPTLFFNLLLGMIAATQYFAQAFIISTAPGGGGGPDNSLMFFSLNLYNQAFTQFNMGYAAALSWVLTVAVMALTCILVVTSRKWVHYGT